MKHRTIRRIHDRFDSRTARIADRKTLGHPRTGDILTVAFPAQIETLDRAPKLDPWGVWGVTRHVVNGWIRTMTETPLPRRPQTPEVHEHEARQSVLVHLQIFGNLDDDSDESVVVAITREIGSRPRDPVPQTQSPLSNDRDGLRVGGDLEGNGNGHADLSVAKGVT